MIKINDMGRLINDNVLICSHCQESLNPEFIHFNVNTYKAISLYHYSQFIRQLIYQYKGCYDYELNKVFMNLYFKELKILYSGYYMIPVPSFKEDDERRGFNHVAEIFNNLGLKTLDILEKINEHKQAKSSFKERQKVYKSLAIKTQISLKNKKVLVVDDIYTTGATMKSAINLIEKLNPKDIEILVIAKTKAKTTEK